MGKTGIKVGPFFLQEIIGVVYKVLQVELKDAIAMTEFIGVADRPAVAFYKLRHTYQHFPCYGEHFGTVRYSKQGLFIFWKGAPVRRIQGVSYGQQRYFFQ